MTYCHAETTQPQIDSRRKFGSQTSDNMDRWKAEMGRVREEKRRRNKIKEEKFRKKIQGREKVGKSRNTVFFQWFVAPEGRKVGSLKRRVVCWDDFAWQVQDFVWLGITFTWQAQHFRHMDWKNRKTQWYEAVSSALNFPFLKEVSQNCFLFDVVNLKDRGSLAE